MRIIKKINWDFSTEKTNVATHDFHPYAAKFIPQIPASIINLLSEDGETTYDPFCGSGTTLVEALRLGRNGIGNDVNPLAVLITKVKTTPISKDRLKILSSLMNNVTNDIEIYYGTSLFSSKDVKIIRPPINNLDYWFRDFVIDELSIIKHHIDRIKDTEVKHFCLVAFSSILVPVSNQDSETRYSRVIKDIKKFDVVKKFCKRINHMVRKMESVYEELRKRKSKVVVHDTRNEVPFKTDQADIVITSPPYPNAYDYHLYHKYRLLWLKMNPLDLRKKEIGAHADYSKKNGFTEKNFETDMVRCFDSISRILKNGRYFCIVIGDSIIKGKRIKNNELFKKLSRKTNFRFEGEITRNINLRKKSFNPAIGNIKTENLMFFVNKK